MVTIPFKNNLESESLPKI